MLMRKTLVLFNKSYGDYEFLLFLIVLMIIINSMTSVRLILISTLMIALAMVCEHGVFRVLEDIFLDEKDPSTRFILP